MMHLPPISMLDVTKHLPDRWAAFEASYMYITDSCWLARWTEWKKRFPPRGQPQWIAFLSSPRVALVFRAFPCSAGLGGNKV